MIINRIQHGTAIHSRVELFAKPSTPTLILTIVRGSLSLEPALEMTYEQAQQVRDTLNRLLTAIDNHADSLEVTQLHPHAETLLQVAEQREPWVKRLNIKPGKEEPLD